MMLLIMYRPRDSDEMQNLTIIARETAPGSSSQDMYVNDTTKTASTIGNYIVCIYRKKIYRNQMNTFTFISIIFRWKSNRGTW